MRTSFLFFFLAISVSAVNGAAVNIGTNTLAGTARGVLTTSGAPLPIGSMVRIGLFSPTATPARIAAATSFAELNSLFIPIGEDSSSAADGTNGPGAVNSQTVAGAPGGGWGFTINAVENSDSRFAAGLRLYLMILDVPAASLASASSALVISDPSWLIPAAGTRTMSTSVIGDQSEVFVGTYGPTSLTLSAVPEPTSVALGGLAALGLMARRRRVA
jgi:hypothetical protein